MTIEQQLFSLMTAFENRALSFDDFAREFSDTYLDGADDLPDGPATRMFDAVHERLEWTTTAPPPEDRAHGWGDPADFREWLAALRREERIAD